jgi:hypothetical protein
LSIPHENQERPFQAELADVCCFDGRFTTTRIKVFRSGAGHKHSLEHSAPASRERLDNVLSNGSNANTAAM